MPQTPPEKRVRVTTVRDQPERSVRDFLQYRPGPLQPPPAPTAPGFEAYRLYVQTYRWYLSQLAEIRKDFAKVFVEGGSFVESVVDDVSDIAEARSMLPPRETTTIPPGEPVPGYPGVGPQRGLYAEREFLIPDEESAINRVHTLLENAERQARQRQRQVGPIPIVTVAAKPPPSEQEAQALAALKKVRRANKRKRAAARRKAKAAASAPTPAEATLKKVAEVESKVQLLKAEERWTKVQTRAEKRKAKTAPQSAVGPSAARPPNRRERRRAIYGPPAVSGSQIVELAPDA